LVGAGVIKPHGETRPPCRWTEHVWKLVGYVANTQQAAQRFACPNCGRVLIKGLRGQTT
jgi:predicted RNA-binding Zn-ribbon protein involved in translation (DUF1610 family)